MKNKPRLFSLSSILIFILILSACSGGGSDEGNSPEVESSDSVEIVSGCNAIETVTGISRQVCYTTTCDNLENTYLYTYDEKTETNSCDASAVVGICASIKFETYYYEGDADKLESECKYNIGTWSTN